MGFISSLAGGLGGVGLGEAVVSVAVDTGPLKSGLEAAKADVAAASSSMSSAAQTISTGFIVAGAASVLALGKAVASTNELGLATLGLQRVTGQSAESASSLLFVADKMGVSATTLTAAFGALAKNIANNGKALATYDLHLTNTDGSTKDFNTVLGIAADKYRSLGQGQAGAAFAMALFGKSGKALIPILQQGSEGMAQMEEEAKKYGVVIGQDVVNKSLAASQASADFHSSLQGLGITVGASLQPVMTTLVHVLTEVVTLLSSLPPSVLQAIPVFSALAGAVGFGVRTFNLAKAALVEHIASMAADAAAAKAAAASATQLSFAMDAEAASATGAAGASGLFGAAIDLALGPVGLVAGAVGLLTAGFVSGAQEAANEAAIIDGLSEKIRTANLTLDQYLSSQEIQAAVQKLTASGLISYADAMQKVTDFYTKGKAEADSYAGSIDGLTAANQAAQQAIDDATAALQAQKDAQDALLPGILGLVGQSRSLAAAEKTYQQDLKSGHASRQTLIDDQLAILNARQSEKSSLSDYISKLDESGRSQDFVTKKLEAMGTQLGISKSVIDGLIAKVFGLKHALDSVNGTYNAQINIVEHFATTGSLGGHVQGGRT